MSKQITEIFLQTQAGEADVRAAYLINKGWKVARSNLDSFTFNDATNAVKGKSFKFNKVIVLDATK